MDKQRLQDDNNTDDLARSAPRRWLRAAFVRAAMVIVARGHAASSASSRRSRRRRGARPPADGIVVLTGGSSRVSDAIELLANGYGQRLLISGVHPTNAAATSRGRCRTSSLLSCCIDLDRSAVNTRSNAAETRRWARDRGLKSLIVVTSNYHMPRAIVELSHAMPDVS